MAAKKHILKHSWGLILFFVFTNDLFGQIQDIRLADDLIINRLYAGINNNTGIQLDSANRLNSISIRLGTRITHYLSPKIRVRSFGVAHLENNKPVSGFSSYEVLLTILPKLEIQAGLFTTPSTELRPNPTTWESQVETQAQSTIIGGRLGAKINYKINETSSFSYGLYDHNQHLAHHLRFTYKTIKLAGYLEPNGAYFTALDINWKLIQTVLTYTDERRISHSIFIHALPELSCYSDIRYDSISRYFDYTVFGVRKHFQSEHYYLKGFMAISYNPVNEIINGQLFLHLFKKDGV